MKRPRPALILLAPLLLTHCVVVDPSAGGSGYPGNQPGYESPSGSTYRLGQERGYEDGQSGRSRNPRRHDGDFPPAEASVFNRGYEAGYNSGMGETARPGYPTQLPDMAPVPDYPGRLTAESSAGSVIIRQGSRTLTSFRTAGPNVEETRFINGQEQIVVKSRGNHGPATVQLFSARNGREEGRVMAYEIRNGFPVWAAGMGE